MIRKRSKLISKIKRRRGASLVEVVAGLSITSVLLVPTAGMFRTVVTGQKRQLIRNELLTEARSRIAESSMEVRTRFRGFRRAGRIAGLSERDVRYETLATDNAASGGVKGRMMAISTVLWYDENRNRRVDDTEVSVDLWTAVSRVKR